MSSIKASSQRRFALKHNDPAQVKDLPADNKAVLEARTIFPSTVYHASESPRLLISGHNNPKLGRKITKGAWKGLHIFALTLEERATCSKDCFMWRGCYGNSMHMARRHTHGIAFERTLEYEVDYKLRKYPDGIAIRLHVLGDFYSTEYIQLWSRMLRNHPQLHAWGYTSRLPDSADSVDSGLGMMIAAVKAEFPDRFRIRWSSEESLEDGATVIRRYPEEPKIPEGTVCPTAFSEFACCAECAMCWSDQTREETIVFPMHGRVGRGQSKQKGKVYFADGGTRLEPKNKPVHASKSED